MESFNGCVYDVKKDNLRKSSEELQQMVTIAAFGRILGVFVSSFNFSELAKMYLINMNRH